MGSYAYEAELRLPIATAQLVHFVKRHPIERTLVDPDSYRLDLCLTPRTPGARICFSDHWAAHRYEKPGKVFIIPPGESLRIRSDAGEQGAIICRIHTAQIREWLEEDLAWSESRLNASVDVSSVAIRQLLLRLGEEMREPGFASHILSEGLVLQIAVELARFYRDIPDQASAGGLAPWRLRLIDERLQDDSRPPTLSELAALCRISVRQLTRGYRASRRSTIGEHVAQSRMESAKQMLAAGGSVKSVAHSLGFTSSSSFCTAFRKATGATPSRFRR